MRRRGTEERRRGRAEEARETSNVFLMNLKKLIGEASNNLDDFN